MVRMINRLTGGDMWVHETRVDSYIAAGHRLAASTPAKQEPVEKAKKKKAPEK